MTWDEERWHKDPGGLYCYGDDVIVAPVHTTDDRYGIEVYNFGDAPLVIPNMILVRVLADLTELAARRAAQSEGKP